MKKVVLIALLVLFAFEAEAQISTKTIGSLKLNGFSSVNYEMSINYDISDTLYYLFMAYQNSDYKYITAVESIFISIKEDLESFINDLETIYRVVTENEQLTFKRERYTLTCYNWTNMLYIGDGKSNTTMKASDIQKLIDWLKTLPIEKFQ